uniref:Uncharacterized protein n=1 Tax=Babesia bovis TaxID=5865 RepID=S6B149_BABBO|nr:hypothetical protein [Babesia bovis]
MIERRLLPQRLREYLVMRLRHRLRLFRSNTMTTVGTRLGASLNFLNVVYAPSHTSGHGRMVVVGIVVSLSSVVTGVLWLEQPVYNVATNVTNNVSKDTKSTRNKTTNQLSCFLGFYRRETRNVLLYLGHHLIEHRRTLCMYQVDIK